MAWAASIRTTEAKVWRAAPAAPGAESLARGLGISPAIARLLISRGYADVASARAFLNPAAAHLHPPGGLRDMDLAVRRIRRAIQERQSIEIHGDYDVDGTTSTVILKTAIEMAGGLCSFRIPHRLRDGYGMQAAAVEQAAASGVKLIVSVDTGIRAKEVVEKARDLGVDVVITDHHLPESELPRAAAVINPNRSDCAYPNKSLCGVGVAFKLAEALLSELGWAADRLRRVLDSFLKLVALGTVADVVPLTGENRAIVRIGLEGLRKVSNPGLRALLDQSGVNEGSPPTARQAGFQIAPRINAAGRMASANSVVELFFTRDAGRARAIALELQRLNEQRQKEEAGIIELILEQCAAQPVNESHFALVFSGVGWHRGVLGIVASRMVERFHRPTFVLGEDGGQASGSGRGIPGFHLLDALDGMREIFLKYGGHSHAAGLTIPCEAVEAFRTRLNMHAAARLTLSDLLPTLQIDSEVGLGDMDEAFYQDLRAMEPFGAGNRAPVFAARGLRVLQEPRLLKEKHIRVNLCGGGRALTFKGFHFAERAREFAQGACVDVAFSIEEDTWNGGWTAILQDVRASGTEPHSPR